MEANRPARPWRRVLAVAGVLAVVTAASAGGAAWAATSFSDVPPSNPFADEIAQVAGACIAQGYDDGTYRPGQPVTRGSMAAFLSRVGGRIGTTARVGEPFVHLGTPTDGEYSGWVPVAQGRIDLPDDDCTHTIHLIGTASVFTNGTRADTCYDAIYCNAELALFVGGSLQGSTITRLNADGTGDSMAVQARHETGAASVAYELRVRTFRVKAGAAIVASDRDVVATSYAFATPEEG